MIKQINNFTIRAFSILILSVLLLEHALPIWACGPSFLEPVFIFKARPDFPREKFIEGNLGVVNPTYARSNLYVAYRYLNNAPLTPLEQKSVSYFWDRNNRDAETPDDPTQRAAVKWISTRNQVTNELPPNYAAIDLKNYAYTFALEMEKKYKGYVSYINCHDNALVVAAETLHNRIANYGAENPHVKEWLKGQDVVFSNCSQGGSVPPDAAADAPQWLKNDREYQIAAAHFYIGNFDEARNRFARIANSSDSVWSELADYLVGRTLVRQANFAGKEIETKTYFEKAETHFQKVIAKNTKYRSDALALLNLVKFRLYPERRTHELNVSLIQTNPGNDLGQDLIDYIWLLDRFESDALAKIDEKINPPEQPTPTPQPTAPPINSNTLSNTPSNTSSNTAASSSNQTYPLNRSNSMTNSYSNSNVRPVPAYTPPPEPNRYKDDTYPFYYRELKLGQKDVPPFLLEDDLSDWLFNYQLSDEESLAHAIGRWQKTAREHWLMSVLSKLTGAHASADQFLRAAEKVSRSSKAFPTVSFHAARLLIEQGKPAEARRKLDRILADPVLNLPLSARNQFLRQRMLAAENLEEFLKFATRRASVFAWDNGAGYEDFSAKPKGEDYLPDERVWKDRLMFDEDAQQVFEKQMPLAVLKNVVKSHLLPDYLKRQLLIPIWARAVLLENDAVSRELAPLLARHAPEMQNVISQFQNSQTPRNRRHSALYALIKFPAFDPHFRSGMGRLTPLAQIDNYRDNWWCANHERTEDVEEGEKAFEAPRISFLTDAEIEMSKAEQAKLKALGDAPPYLVSGVIEWAQASPGDGRVPEALHLAVKTTRYGCYSEDIGKYSKEAFDFLHRRYPNSVWAKKTPYWFKY